MGDVGWVSQVADGTLQVTTGEDKIYSVRRTSARFLSPAVTAVEAVDVQVPVIQLGRVQTHLGLMEEILGSGRISLAQWANINRLICEMFEHPDP